jgi:hypothetical protein
MTISPNKILCAGLSFELAHSIVLIFNLQNSRTHLEVLLESHEASMIVVGVLTMLAFALRLYKINHPDQVVFVQLRVYTYPPISSLNNLILDLTRFISGNSPPSTFHGNTTLMSTRRSQNSFLVSPAGSLGSMVNSTSKTLVIAIRKTMFLTWECALCPQFLVVSPSQWYMRS